MKPVLICLFLVLTVGLHSQSKLLDSYVQKNILFYNLSREYKTMQCFDEEDYGIHNSIINCNWVRMIPEKCSEILLIKRPVDLYYPNDSITLVCYEKHGYQLFDSSKNMITDIGNYLSRQFDDLYLVGYNIKIPDQIKFISGNIFKDKIWVDFAGGGFERSNIVSYLKLKCFNLRLSKIKYLKTIGNEMIFAAQLENFQNTFRIIFNKKKPDLVLLKYKKTRYTL